MQNSWKLKLGQTKQDELRMDEGYENQDVRAEMWIENLSWSAQMKSEEMVSL
jgi:hypothetical protein